MNSSRLSTVIGTGMVAGAVLLAFYGNAHAQAFQGSVGHFHHSRAVTAPEIDPAVAISGLSMLAGGLALIFDKFRRRNR